MNVQRQSVGSVCFYLRFCAHALLFGLIFSLPPARPAPAETIHEFQKLTASDAAARDRFGRSVSIEGDTAIIGASGDNIGSGSAYVFTNAGKTWSQAAKLTSSDANTGDDFGWSVSIDGDMAIIGAHQDDEVATDAGSAYIFTNTGGTWNQTAKLTASDSGSDDSFGCSVSISGNTAIIGAYRNGDAGINYGSAYIFTNVVGTWSQTAKLNASDAAAFDNFGHSVSIDGNTAIVGAWGNDDAGSCSGSAYVFTNIDGIWSQTAKLTASDADGNDLFGYSVSISNDMAIVGAAYDTDVAYRSGSAYIFANTDGTWSQMAKLTVPDATVADQFGHSVSISEDMMIVGARTNNGMGISTGSAYVFVNTGGTWNQVVKLTASDVATEDDFGWSVSVSGNTAIVGSYQDDDVGDASGSAYLFTVPEPSAGLLGGLALPVLIGLVRRRRR